jgi:hypothetical protein
MGMDPVLDGELYEVTIALEGRVTKAKYDAFIAAIDVAIQTAGQVGDPPYGGQANKLKVRKIRSVVRPK